MGHMRKLYVSLVLAILIAIAVFVHRSFIVVRSKAKDIIDEEDESTSSLSTTRKQLVIGPLSSSRTTVISVYFLFKSKHSPKKYDNWMRTFLASVSGAPLVMFIDASSYEKYKHLRNSTQTRTAFLVYDNIWQMLRELEVERNRSYTESYLLKQRDIDPEKGLHTADLYAIWNLKAFMVNKVLDMNPYKSEFFIYSDAGAWRSEQPIENWPNEQFVDDVAAKIEDRMLFGKIGPKDAVAPGKKISIEGTFFAGSTSAMRDYKRAFYDMHDKMLDAGLFVGK